MDPKEQNPTNLEAEVERQPWRQEIFSRHAWFRYGLFVLAAVLTGLAALYFNRVEEVGRLFFEVMQGDAEVGMFFSWFGIENDWTWTMPGALGTIIPIALVIVGMIVICRLRDVYFKGTEGTGIPQAIASLKTPEGPIRKRMLSLRIALGKMLLLTIGLFTGMTIGREGPSVHVGACCMYLITKVTRFQQNLVRRGLILGGGGAGIAAAFNAPVAGIVFAFEEIGRGFEKNNAGTIIRTVIIACVVGIVFLGDYLFYGNVNKGGNVELDSVMQWVAVPVIGIIGGLLGGCFAWMVVHFTPVVTRNVKKHPYMTAGFLGACLGGLALISSGLSYGSGFAEAQIILMQEAQPDFPWLAETSFPWHYPITKAAANFFCLISGIPGGLFDPSLSVGAGIGQVAHPLFSTLFDGISMKAVVMMFMVAYFTGVVQSPITCFVILVEMTDGRYMTIALAATAVIAYEMSHLVCRTAIYEALADIFLKNIDEPVDVATSESKDIGDQPVAQT
jgi:H+/Cl- antiporter ClcA